MRDRTVSGDQTQSYASQVEALQRGEEAEAAGDTAGVIRALDDFCSAAGAEDDVRESMQKSIAQGGTLIKTVWAETGGVSTSLFAFLPGCQHCLTQAKSAYGRGAESDRFVDLLGLMNNPMIPTSPDAITANLLPEFARLQGAARSLVAA